MVYFVSVFYFRNRITKEAQKIKEKKKELSPIVSEFLFYDENGDKIEKINYIGLKIEVRELIKSPFDRKVLTEILMDLRKDVSGTTRNELFHIYQDLGLHEDAFKKLKSWRWEVISKGIFELTQMHVEEAYKPITRFINDKRPTVRKQAEIAVVTLNREGIIYFLDHTTYRISEWQQLKLLDVVRNKEDYLAPPFRLWLTSKNNYVVLFALRLIKHYNQNDANISLITLIKHKSNQIKREAIHCIKEFYVTEALPVLKQTFGSNNTDIKMHILDTIAEIGSDEDIPFLQSISESNDTFMVKNKAVRAINTISPESILPTKDIEPLSGLNNSENLENGFVAKDVESNNQGELTHDSHIKELSSVERNSSDENFEDISDDYHSPLETESVKDLEIDEVEGIEKDSSVVLTETEIAFLPYIVDSETERLDDSGVIEKSLNEIIVDFEVVKAEKITPLLDFNFLPLVIEGQNERKKDVLEFPVIYEEVIAIQKEDSLNIGDLEVFYEEIIPVQSTDLNKDIDFDLLDFSEINPSEVIGKGDTNMQADEGDYMQWPIDFEVKFSDDENHQEKNFEEQLSHPDISSDLIIPKPKFHEDLDTMALLENIEELGDEREIPFLRSMMETETSPDILEKIKDILDHFISKYSSKEAPKKGETEKGYSVFEELIIKGDLESKLFLLNQIAELGDTKELYLLNVLVSDENKTISETAAQVLKVLKKRLEDDAMELVDQNIDSSVSIEELIKKDYPDFFTLNFEPSGNSEFPEKKEVPARMNSSEKGTLFDHLCNMSTKFYNKKNG
ncbi:hypothetical protein CJ263_19265 [Maribacter cobaltidurans]|uniref:Uncharacterized protein n=2 Tax=Maribacter cobaltidurans TaxID=1178778 RepID=A0A223V9Z3_9FLAO|nr:hypothetical protein CJ263_19265 [Maribacter cobaltidurans]GGD91025.1 hypothetical protein GCM10011412_31250 [Maribacter cobaltidurans]